MKITQKQRNGHMFIQLFFLVFGSSITSRAIDLDLRDTLYTHSYHISSTLHV